jgi:hypothetical protein
MKPKPESLARESARARTGRPMKQKRTKYYEIDNPEGYAKLQAFEDFAKRLMLEFLGTEWKFDWMRDRIQVRTLAKCTYYHKGSISYGFMGWLLFSREIVEYSPQAQRDVIMHEIAHALTDMSHGPEWKAMARQLGTPEKAHLVRY